MEFDLLTSYVLCDAHVNPSLWYTFHVNLFFFETMPRLNFNSIIIYDADCMFSSIQSFTLYWDCYPMLCRFVRWCRGTIEVKGLDLYIFYLLRGGFFVYVCVDDSIMFHSCSGEVKDETFLFIINSWSILSVVIVKKCSLLSFIFGRGALPPRSSKVRALRIVYALCTEEYRA